MEIQLPFASLKSFLTAAETWIETPEHISAPILRAEILSDDVTDGDVIDGNFKRVIVRRCLPRKHRHDSTFTQRLILRVNSADGQSSAVLHHRLLSDGAEELPEHFPYFYPQVQSFSIEYRQLATDCAVLSANFLPLPGISPDDAHVVTTLEHILFKIAKFTKGNYNSPTGRYEKRVHHDQLVPKDTFQDCYAQLKDRYKHWVQLWGASEDAAQDCKHGGMTTDPQKHVFEDIAIATFLICLWRQSEGPKPRFVDLGCGNGFLVHLLAMEGFHGYGFDIAKRKIWDLYGKETDLRVETFYPPQASFEHLLGNADNDGGDVWLIGNHPDELTPWIPILAAQSSLSRPSSASPRIKFFVLPCCFHDFSGARNPFGITIPMLFEPGKGRYESYLAWIESIAHNAGFAVEKEWMRIPSTKNAALIGRAWRSDRDEDGCRAFIADCLTTSFQPRLTDTERQRLNNERKEKMRRTDEQIRLDADVFMNAFGDLDVHSDTTDCDCD